MSFLNKLFGASNANPATAKAATAINAAEARARIDGATPPFLLDVREPYEYAEGHIHGARLIPMGELGRRLNGSQRGRLEGRRGRSRTTRVGRGATGYQQQHRSQQEQSDDQLLTHHHVEHRAFLVRSLG